MENIESLFLIPKELRGKVKVLCPESTSEHLGSTKSKGKFNRHFCWPNLYKDTDKFAHIND